MNTVTDLGIILNSKLYFYHHMGYIYIFTSFQVVESHLTFSFPPTDSFLCHISHYFEAGPARIPERPGPLVAFEAPNHNEKELRYMKQIKTQRSGT
jgi:hypothetical protein